MSLWEIITVFLILSKSEILVFGILEDAATLSGCKSWPTTFFPEFHVVPQNPFPARDS